MTLTDLRWKLVGLGDWCGWQPLGQVRNCDDETTSIHAIGKRAAGFSNVKSIAFITLDL